MYNEENNNKQINISLALDTEKWKQNGSAGTDLTNELNNYFAKIGESILKISKSITPKIVINQL